eukprot:CAMPEP_0184855914 /NCGR_PEP_ID=MMETSP0580-20130426/1087_1 /TAXON_ID=1118495 /ORGANISM="Dactyliosolen fragilissimus" /LENGTH=72 /DNA_ID=CAMNT_0027350611 /DNA_START=632 /DNA_END=850 /DNA_ORIENTATION=-
MEFMLNIENMELSENILKQELMLKIENNTFAPTMEKKPIAVRALNTEADDLYDWIHGQAVQNPAFGSSSVDI